MNIIGHISVIVGCMYASKTTELQSRIAFYKKDGCVVKSFTKDSRNKHKLVNHDGDEIDAIYVSSCKEILEQCADDVQVVAIDEGQFYDIELIDVCKTLANKGVAVMVAGLDQDYLGRPFETMAALMAEAEIITKLLAICKCGGPAIRNYRKVNSSERILEGNEDVYEAMCRKCFEKTRE